MHPWIKQHEKGSLLLLYIQPGASDSEICGLHGLRIKIKVKAPPRDGEANDAVIELLAKFLKVSKQRIFLIRGESSRQKDLLVELPLAQVIILMQELL